MALTSSPLLSSSLFCSPLSFSLLSPVFFLPKWPSESLMIQRDCVSIGRCVSCLVTLKINHLATLSQSVTFLCFPGTDCSKSTGPLGEMRAGKGVRWSGQSPSKLAIRLHISSDSESVMPAIMPTTQHHGSCWGPMTASYGRNRFGVERWSSYVTENLPCARPCVYWTPTMYQAPCLLLHLSSSKGGLGSWLRDPGQFQLSGSCFCRLETLHHSLMILFGMMEGSWG